LKEKEQLYKNKNKKIKDNLKKRYGAFEGVTDHGLKDNYLTNSKILEYLKDSEK